MINNFKYIYYEKLLLYFFFILISYTSNAQCDGEIYVTNDDEYEHTSQWIFGTYQMYNGGPPTQGFPMWTTYLFEVIDIDNGNVLAAKAINPQDGIQIYGGQYRYYYTFNDDCSYDGEDGNQIKLRVSKVVNIMESFDWENGIHASTISIDVCAFGHNGYQFANKCDWVDGGNGNSDLPNLKFSKLTVEVDGTTYDTSDGFNNVPILKYGKEHTFNIFIENDDTGDASTSPYTILLSTGDDTYPIWDGVSPIYSFMDGNAGSIDGNSESTDSFSQYIYDSIGLLDLEANTDYTMYIDIDPNNDVDDESNENDNISQLYFRYENSSGRINLNYGLGTIIIPYDYTDGTISTNVKIYSYINPFFPVLNININEQNANVDISSLPTGKYIVHVNDVFERLFGLKGSSGIIIKPEF